MNNIITQRMLDICSPAQGLSREDRERKLAEEFPMSGEETFVLFEECLRLLFDQPNGEEALTVIDHELLQIAIETARLQRVFDAVEEMYHAEGIDSDKLRFIFKTFKQWGKPR